MSYIDIVQTALANAAFDLASVQADELVVERYQQYIEVARDNGIDSDGIMAWSQRRGLTLLSYQHNTELQLEIKEAVALESSLTPLTAIVQALTAKVSRNRIKYRSREITGSLQERKVLAEIEGVFACSAQEADQALCAAREHHLQAAPIDEARVYDEYLALRTSLNISYVNGSWKQGDMDREATEIEELLTGKIVTQRVAGVKGLMVPQLVAPYMLQDRLQLDDTALRHVREYVTRPYEMAPEEKDAFLRKMTYAYHKAYRLSNNRELTHRMICQTLWQIKCRLLGINITHLTGSAFALIATGAPHTGKTHGFHVTFAPLGAAFYVPKGTMETMWDSFGARMFSKYYVYNLDEIAAQSSDLHLVQRMNSIKAFLTGDRNNSRRMHSQEVDTTKIRATFVGSTNHDVKDVFPDRTGGVARRIYALRVGLRPNEVPSVVEPDAYAVYFDPANIQIMWSCIDETLPNGYLVSASDGDLYETLLTERETYIPETSVEVWAKSTCRLVDDARTPLVNLHNWYDTWCNGKYAPNHKMNINQIIPELRRIYPDIVVRTHGGKVVVGIVQQDIGGAGDIGQSAGNQSRQERESAAIDRLTISAGDFHAQLRKTRVDETPTLASLMAGN